MVYDTAPYSWDVWPLLYYKFSIEFVLKKINVAQSVYVIVKTDCLNRSAGYSKVAA